MNTDWQDYESEVIRAHRLRENVNKVWAWGKNDSPPESVLEEAGYITSYNKLRLKRRLDKNGGRLPDCGFDFLSLENDSVYCGGQAKYYKDKVTANNLGTFLMYQANLRAKNPASVGYLYTTSKLQEDLRDNVENPAFGVTHVLHKWKPGNVILNKVVELQECDYELRDYQKDLLEEMKSGVGLICLTIPCGLGKTLLAGHHIRERGPKLIVAIAPLRESVRNLKERLGCFFKDYKMLLVDSDESSNMDNDVVTKFLESDDCKIIYTTFVSAVGVLAEVLVEVEDKYILGDEIHNALGNLDLCEFINSFSGGLIMSATIPEETTINGEVRSLSELIKIEHIYSRSFAFAIERGLIVDYNLWLPHQNIASDGTTNVAIEIPVGFESYEKDICAMCCYLATGMLKTGSRRCIVYLGSQGECDRFIRVAKDIFQKYQGLDFWAGTIISNVCANERKRLLAEFQSGYNSVFRILASVRILDEAVDVPRCDSVFITKVGEASSDIRMMQRAMRSGRLDPENPNKKNNIFLWADGWEKCIKPLELLREADPEFHKKVRIIDSDYDVQSCSKRVGAITEETKEFARFINMKCMSLFDRHLLRIEECKKFYGKYKEQPIHNGKRENEAVLSCWMSRIRKINKSSKLSNELKSAIAVSLPWFYWDKYLDGYENSLKELVEFYNKYGEPIGNGIREDGKEKILNWWIGTLRKSRKRGKLPDGFEDKVNAACPWFRWENNLDEKRYQILNNIVKFYSDFKEAPKFEGIRHNGMEKSYAIWLARKRTDKKKGNINAELEKKINDLLPWFRWDPMNETHIDKINEIVKFYEEHGKEPTKSHLSVWMTARRREKARSELSSELENLIKEKLPWFSWDPINEQRDEMLDKLLKYYKQYGKPPTWKGGGVDEATLAAWIIARRQNKKNGSLTIEFENKINTLCPWFVWDSRDDILAAKHKNTIYEIKYFYSKYGRPVAGRERENGKESVFVEWISTIKKNKKKTKLDKEIEELINKELPWFVWGNIHETRCNKTIEAIKVFYDKCGEPKCRGERENGLEGKLGAWLSQKRGAKRKGELDAELEKDITLAFPWFVWEPEEDEFNKSLQDLQEFYLEYGVPKFDGERKYGKEKEIAAWMGSRRCAKTKGKLSAEEEAKIMGLCPWFCWDPFGDTYRTNLGLLKDYYVTNGKEPTPKEKQLYQFILKLRIDKRKGKLSIDEQNEINTMFPWFIWEGLEGKHNNNIKLMKEFYNKHGPPKSNGVREGDSEKDLYRWICKRREAKKKGQLTQELEKQINEELPWLDLEPSKNK